MKVRNLDLCFVLFDPFMPFAFSSLMMDTASAPQIVVNRPNGLDEGVDLPTDDHLMTLKALTEKLRLETRRPSYQEWKARLEAECLEQTGKHQIHVEPEGKLATNKETAANSDEIQRKLPSAVLKGFENIDEALTWLRRELVSTHFSKSF